MNQNREIANLARDHRLKKSDALNPETSSELNDYEFVSTMLAEMQSANTLEAEEKKKEQQDQQQRGRGRQYDTIEPEQEIMLFLFNDCDDDDDWNEDLFYVVQPDLYEGWIEVVRLRQTALRCGICAIRGRPLEFPN